MTTLDMSQTPKLEEIYASVASTAALPLDRARSLPKAAYTDDDFYAAEKVKLLSAGWMCIAHVSQLKNAGDFLAVDLLDEPLVVVRGQDQVVRVLSRVCVHRGMDLMPEGTSIARRGTTRTLLCPYHFWSFDLSGQLVGCPHMEGATGFDRKDWRLPEIRSEIWNGFVFVNLDGAASPLSEQYADFDRVIAPWNVAEMEVVITLDWDCAFNWKVMVENWMESYHHLGAHNQTLNVTMPAQNTWTEPARPYFVQCHLPFKPSVAEFIAAALAEGRKQPGFTPVPGLAVEQHTEWGVFVGYPCFMFLTAADRVLWYRLLPLSSGRCALQTMTLVTRDAMAAPDYAETLVAETKMLRDFHQEDMLVNAGVQRGLRSAAFQPGRLSHLEEPVWQFQQYLARHLAPNRPTRWSA
jgi:phenylpropionate dioxygenase-like ring-hydroxylating dioxygenase large terminal subunit